MFITWVSGNVSIFDFKRDITSSGFSVIMGAIKVKTLFFPFSVSVHRNPKREGISYKYYTLGLITYNIYFFVFFLKRNQHFCQGKSKLTIF